MKPGQSGDAPGAAPPWSVAVSVADVSEAGRHVELAADEATRAMIAKAANLVSLSRLEAVFDLSRYGRDGVRVAGHVSATAVQSCVVTLEPLESPVEEHVDVTFVPPRVGASAKNTKSSGSDQDDDAAAIVIDALDAPDPPEVLTGDHVDLGVIATEFLLLGLDPYPRKPDAEFGEVIVGTPGPNPFAVLAALKKNS